MNLAPIHFAHANGFPAQSYQYFLEQLHPHPVSYVNVLGEGEYRLRYPWDGWSLFGKEIVEAIERQHDEPVIGLGHSLGGVAVFHAARMRPDLFRKVIILDPPFSVIVGENCLS